MPYDRLVTTLMRPAITRHTAAFAFLLSFNFPAGLSAQQSGQAPSLSPPATIKSHVNEVIVPVVVRDGQGKLVSDLTRHDFQVFDDGKPQTLTGFMLVKHVPSADAAPPANAPNSNSLPMSAPSQPGSPSQRFVVLLFDDLNLSSGELDAVRNSARKAIETALSSSDIVAVLATSGTNSGLTRDRAVLHKALANLKSQKIFQRRRECPEITGYEADLIVNRHDPNAIAIAVDDAHQCGGLSADPSLDNVAAQMALGAAQRIVAAGEQNLRTNFDFLRLVVSRMAALPGQRMLIFVSPGFLTDTSEAMERNSEILDIASRGNVTINALDATGLSPANLEAGERAVSPALSAVRSTYRVNAVPLAQGVLAELADGTGGTFFHDNNNFDAGLSSLLAGPEYLYLVAFSIADIKPNGAYHKLTVKVAKDGLKVQARRGYFAPKPEPTK